MRSEGEWYASQVGTGLGCNRITHWPIGRWCSCSRLAKEAQGTRWQPGQVPPQATNEDCETPYSAVMCLLIKSGGDRVPVWSLAPASGLLNAQELLGNWPLLTKYQDPFLAHARAEVGWEHFLSPFFLVASAPDKKPKPRCCGYKQWAASNKNPGLVAGHPGTQTPRMRLSEHVLFNTGGNRSWQSCWRRNDGLCCSIMPRENGQWSGYSPGFAWRVRVCAAACSMLSASSKSTGAGIIAIPGHF